METIVLVGIIVIAVLLWEIKKAVSLCPSQAGVKDEEDCPEPVLLGTRQLHRENFYWRHETKQN